MNDKTKKIFKVVYIAGFFAVCVTPFVGMFFSSDSSTSENRTLSDKPTLLSDDGSINLNFSTDVETYLSEHMGLRNSLISINNHIYYDIFNQSAEDDVIVGSNGWLYYSQTLDDYLGRNVLSDKEIDCIVKVLALQQEYVESYGGQYVFTITPNKNTIYPENMPSRYVKETTENNLSKLEKALANSSVNYCNIKEALSSTDGILYHKKDTHWNNHGALVAYNTLLDFANVPHDDYYNVSFQSSKSWVGDLDNMLFPNTTNTDYQIDYDIDFNYTYTSRLRTDNLDDINISTANENGSGSLLMFRDSFGRALLPFMAEAFNTAEFSRTFPYDLSKTSADLVVEELVERNIDTLLNSAPVMFAPQREYVSTTEPTYNDNNILKTNPYTPLEATKVFGKVTCELSNWDDVSIFVTMGDSTFEAFPVFEKDLLEDYSLGSNEVGFSLLVPNTVSVDSANVTIVQNGVEVLNTILYPSTDTE